VRWTRTATLDVLVQKQRNAKAAKRFFRELLKGLHYSSRVMFAGKLSLSAAPAGFEPATIGSYLTRLARH
jgi:transposase-like protein